jgi:hypothetical protein
MGNRLLFLSVLFSLTVSYSHGFDCREISKDEDYEISDLVFIGNVAYVDNACFIIEPKEYFKGEEFGELVAKIENSSIFPQEGDIWLFYAERVANDTIFVSECSWSRRIYPVDGLNSRGIPPPRSPSENFAESLQILQSAFNDHHAEMELQYDILTLRSLKLQKENSRLMESINIFCIKSNALLYGVLISVVILLVLNVFMLYQSQKTKE